MKLGLLTAPFPETLPGEVAAWSASAGFESLEDRLLAADDRPHPTLCRHVPHRRRQPHREPGAATSRARSTLPD